MYTQQCHFEWPWVIMSDLAKYSITWSVARSLCDRWAFCFTSCIQRCMRCGLHACTRYVIGLLVSDDSESNQAGIGCHSLYVEITTYNGTTFRHVVTESSSLTSGLHTHTHTHDIHSCTLLYSPPYSNVMVSLCRHYDRNISRYLFVCLSVCLFICRLKLGFN